MTKLYHGANPQLSLVTPTVRVKSGHGSSDYKPQSPVNNLDAILGSTPSALVIKLLGELTFRIFLGFRNSEVGAYMTSS